MNELTELIEQSNALVRIMSETFTSIIDTLMVTFEPAFDVCRQIAYHEHARRFWARFGLGETRIASYTGEKLFQFFKFRRELRRERNAMRLTTFGTINP